MAVCRSVYSVPGRDTRVPAFSCSLSIDYFFWQLSKDSVMKILTFLALTIAMFSPALSAETHYLAIQVNEDDVGAMNMALNNAQNAERYYSSRGDDIVIEVVTYGPGLKMLLQNSSPVSERIVAAKKTMGNITFSACENTIRAMSQSSGAELALLSEARSVPSGVVRLMELQEQGYSYIRP